MMAASLPLSTAPLSPAVPDDVGPVVVPDYSRAGLPEGVDPEVVAGYVIFHSF